MALTKVDKSVSSTPGIVDNSDATAITIDSSENVGIGTSSPSTLLHQKKDSSGAYVTHLIDNTNAGGYANTTYRCGSAEAGINYAPSIFFAVGPHTNDTTTPITFRNNNASERMRIDTSGNVGIGTTTINTGTLGTSNKFLEVAAGTASGSGTLVLSRDTSGNDNEVGGIRFVNANNADDDGLDADGKFVAAIAARSVTSDSNASDDSGANLQFYTKPEAGNYAERMRISSSGVVNVGTTEGIAKFNVGNGTGNAIIEMASSSATAVYYEHINRSNTSGSVDVGYYARGSGDFKFYTGSYTVRFTINETGGSSGSDEKLKKDIENISYGLETVKSLQPRKFKWKETDNVGIGFIAQEVESLIPEVVADTTDAKGETDEVTKVLNYANLTAVLTKAIQEQQAIIEDLQTQINEVKNGN
mgnify:CR=1 FL=1